MYSHLLRVWVDYHRRGGVDKVNIIDNNSPTDFEQLFAGREEIEVLYWPFRKSQVQLFSFLMHMCASRCKWMLLLDADE